LLEEARKEWAAKVRSTRLQHKMETLYSEYQVDLSMEEKTMWEQKPEEEKEETVLKATKLQPQLLPWKRGGREPPTMKKKIPMMLPQSMISTKVEKKTHHQNIDI
jgi:hypothetical protein